VSIRRVEIGGASLPAATGAGQPRARERLAILALAGLVVTLVVGYLVFRATASGGAPGASLTPYQMLVGNLVSAEQQMYARLQQGVLEAEAIRAQTGRWPEPSALGELPRQPAADEAATPVPEYAWTRTQSGVVVNYLALPVNEDAAAAWLLRIQEPDPNTPVDLAPNDEVHHRLPDGTVLHVSVWTHRFGGRVSSAFTLQPELTGWVQLLTAPVVPVTPLRLRP
jgi:hypothetical protein